MAKPRSRKWEQENPAKVREGARESYHRRRDEILAKCASKTRADRLALIEYLGGVCQDCGDDRWYVLEFHHRPGTEVRRGVISSGTRSLRTKMQEVDKCDLLCANCHLTRTHLNGETRLKRRLTDAS